MSIIEYVLTFLKNILNKSTDVQQSQSNITIEDKPKKIIKPMITADQLYQINANKNKAKCTEYANAFNKILPLYGVDTPLRLVHFLAQVLHESGNLVYESENLNYSGKALLSVFPKYFCSDNVDTYARQPEKIANRVYANRMGNGSEESGDGFLYRGRGLIQLTGRDNYTQCGKDLCLDLSINPDLICNNKDVSVQVACWFWNKNKLNTYADKDDVLTITKRINGGTNGIESRKEILERAKSILLEK